jgi:NADPH:quinone reductase-like Zn-dependent oxidoreductase
MKAIVLAAPGGAENFREEELPLPDVRPGDVRIRVKAASFNPVDYQVRKGGPEARRPHSMILGRDLSGIVDAAHESVAGLRVGEEVYSYVCTLASSGTYAEYVSVPAELVARKPASLSHAQAAAVPVAGITAKLALDKVQARHGRSLFIAGGAGGVGSFAIMLARALGLERLVTTAGSPKSHAYLVEACGLREERIVNYRDAGFVAQALKRNGGAFDAAIDLVGGPMLSACCALLALDGNLASVTEAPGRADFDVLFDKNASFHSVGANAYSLTDRRSSWSKYRDILEQFARDFDSGVLSPPRVSDLGRMSAQVVREAHALLEGGGVQGKLVMSC